MRPSLFWPLKQRSQHAARYEVIRREAVVAERDPYHRLLRRSEHRDAEGADVVHQIWHALEALDEACRRAEPTSDMRATTASTPTRPIACRDAHTSCLRASERR